MQMRLLIAMIVVLLGAPAVRGEADAVTIATLARSLMSDDSHERITAVTELHKLGAEAKPALPSLRAALGRERDVQIRALMLRAINDIERGHPSPRDVPTDVAAQAERLASLIDELDKPDADARVGAIDGLREMGALAFPAIDPLQKIADRSGDRAEQNAALAAIADIRRELWFHDSEAAKKPSDPPTPQKATGKPTRLESYAATVVTLIWQLAGKLEDAGAKVRVRAVRQLAGYDAAAEAALPAMRRLAESDADETVRKLAKLAVERVENAVEATAKARAEGGEGDAKPQAAEGR